MLFRSAHACSQLPDTEEERLMLKQYAAHYALDIAAMLNKV